MVQFSRGHVIIVSFLILLHVTGNKSAINKELKYLEDEEAGVRFSNLLTSIADLNKERMNALKRYTVLDNYNFRTGILRHADETKKDSVVAILMLNNNNGEANDGLLYEDDNSLITPRESPDEDIFNLMNENFDYDNKEVNKINLRSLIANLNDEVMRNDVGLTIDESGIIPINTETIKIETESIPVIPISSSPEYFDRSGNKENKIDFYKYNSRNDNEEIYADKEALQISESHPNINFKTKDVLRMWKSCSKKARKKCVKACKAARKDTCKDYKCSSSMKKSFKKNCKSQCRDKFD